MSCILEKIVLLEKYKEYPLDVYIVIYEENEYN
jgi:hypothetical protein